jgi:hypothetical protein
MTIGEIVMFGTQTDKASAVRGVQELTTQEAGLMDSVATLDGKIVKARATAGTAALDLENGKISQKQYQDLAKRASDIATERDQKAAALVQVRQQLSVAKQALFEATRVDRATEARKLTDQREKYFAEIIAADEAKWKARQKIHEINYKILSAFSSVGLRHGGTMLASGEIDNALGLELARICQMRSLPSAQACPPLPGCKTFILGHADASRQLAERVRQANDFLVKRIVDGYTGEPKAKPTPSNGHDAPAPAQSEPVDPDAALLDASTGPTLSAARIQAAMPHKHLEI